MLTHAVDNNLRWYCAVMDAQGLSYSHTDHLWSLDTDPSPPYYSDIVTCSHAGAAHQLEQIRQCRARNPSHRLCVADCYAALDPDAMADLGFRPLFDSLWFGAPNPLNGPLETALRFVPVEEADTLAAWEARWQRWSPTGGATVFHAGLLERRGVHVWTAECDGEPVGGAITLADDHVIGLSNVFVGESAATGPELRDAARLAARIGQGKPVVGYGAADELDDLAAVGFEALGTHRVWYVR